MSSSPAETNEPPLLAQPNGLVLRLPPPKAAPKKKTMAQGFESAAKLLFGGALGWFGAHYSIELMVPVAPGVYYLIVVAMVPLIWLAAVGWHELGHLAGGWLIGGRFVFWITGPVMIRRTPSGIRLLWNRNVNITGGMAACVPRDPACMTPPRAAVMIVAGPIFSLALAVLALWAAAALTATPGVVPPGQAVAQHVAVVTAGISLFIFLVTAAPGVAGGFKTDGKRVFDLLRGGHRSDQEAAMLALTTAALAGTRPADYDPDLVARVTALKDGSLFDLYGHLNLFHYAADRREWVEAQRLLDYVVVGEAQLVPYVRDSLRCDYAWMLAVNCGADAAGAARAWLDSAGKLDFDPATRLRAEAAVLLAEGKPAEAAAKAKAGLLALHQRSLSPVVSAFAREALEEILQRVERADPGALSKPAS